MKPALTTLLLTLALLCPSTASAANAFKTKAVVLYLPDREMVDRGADADTIAEYLKALEKNAADFWNWAPRQEEAGGLFIGIGIKPGGGQKFWAEAVEGKIRADVLRSFEEALMKTPAPYVRRGPIALSIKASLNFNSVSKFPEFPLAWSIAASERPLRIPDELFDELWPEAALPAPPEQTIPEGIVYHRAEDAENKRAFEALTTALRASPADLRPLLASGTDDLKQTTYIGHFLWDRLQLLTNLSEERFLKVETKIPFGDRQLIYQGIGLRTDEQRRTFSQAFGLNVRFGRNLSIRKLTAAELKLVWPLVGWDLAEPVFTADNAMQKMVFQFRPGTGTLQWIEDITWPCVRAPEAKDSEKTTPARCFCLDGQAPRCK